MANPKITWWQRSSDSDPKRNTIGLRFLVSDLGVAPKETKQPGSTDTAQKDTDSGTPSKDSGEAETAQAENKTEKDASGEKVFHGPGGSRIVVTPTTISFMGYSTFSKTLYDVELKLAGKVKPDSATCNIQKQLANVVLEVQKQELDTSYWTTLVEAKKLGFLKTDFEMWRDEDEQEPVKEDFGPTSLEYEDALGQFAGMEGMGMGGAGGMGIGGDEQTQTGDDDSEMPGLESGEGTEEEKGDTSSTDKPKIEVLP
ncbi:Hsp90 binding co-chaperone (Sba1), putative [Trichophyton verrucosum HKI 0517]|uniref:Hsp90 binding co-chaperone (Sba1), putative n=1 Tax=Trichophyton verrucosum (strain HKI 0517) TaxID=663202 RepID=D4D8I2_TRIVH|nr:Hsp90 binding co-chaperone (Sba1), putative [Trichophyton verrucosum HKI 0517]EFE41850.1 Hsp90 binding co-chaperone (Sba1), putative [Trichophyton verrucosum HKI 0517]